MQDGLDAFKEAAAQIFTPSHEKYIVAELTVELANNKTYVSRPISHVFDVQFMAIVVALLAGRQLEQIGFYSNAGDYVVICEDAIKGSVIHIRLDLVHEKSMDPSALHINDLHGNRITEFFDYFSVADINSLVVYVCG